MQEDVVSALVNLGYQRSPAEQAVKRAANGAGANATFEQLFRQTMSQLQK
jgi:Holliday junction resolvasome RuvABC DNA-binding subunit